MKSIPTFAEAFLNCENGKGTPIDYFIKVYSPIYEQGEKEFLEDLDKALKYYKDNGYEKK